MAVAHAYPREDHVATAGQITFPYSFPINNAGELLVYINSLHTPATLGTHYNVTGVGHPSGGNVVRTSGSTAGDTVAIVMNVTLAQGATFIPHDPFPVQTMNNALDHIARVNQMQAEQLGRAPFFLPGGSTHHKWIAPPVANQFLRWSADAQTIETTPLTIPPFPVSYPAGTLDANAYGLVDAATDPTYDNAGVWAAVIMACPVGGEIIFGPGTYRYTGTIALTKTLSLRGRNRYSSTLVCMTPDLPAMTVLSGFTHLSDFRLDRIIKPVAGGDGLVVSHGQTNNHFERLHLNKQYRGMVLGVTDLSRVDACTAQSCESHGFEADYGTGGVLQWYLTQCLSQLNLGDGYHGANTTATTGIGPFFLDCASFHNGQTGFYFHGEALHTVNDVFLHHCLSSADHFCGIQFDDPHGQLSKVLNCWVELVGRSGGLPMGFDETPSVATGDGHGMRFGGNHGAIGGTNIIGGVVWACSWSGIESVFDNAHYVGITLIDNGQSLDAGIENRAGIVAKGGATHVSSCSFLASSGHQSRGVVVSSVATYVGVDASNLFSGYTLDAMVDTTLATMTGAVSAIAPLGLHINTGVLHLTLHDETGGATPSKTLRVANGHLEILNNARTVAILDLTDEGILTPKGIKIPVVAAGSLPTGAAVLDGQLAIENNGAGDRNLILYAGSQRFRIDGGAPF